MKQPDSLIANNFITPLSFSALVEAKATQAGITLLEAVQLTCESRSIDYDAVKGLVTRQLKMKIAAEASLLNLLKKLPN